MNVKIPISYSAFHTKRCCSISLAGTRMYRCKGACVQAVGDLVPEKGGTIVSVFAIGLLPQ